MKKPAKIAQVRDESEQTLTLFERVKRESESFGGGGRGHKREMARAAYFLWLTLPVRYRGSPEGIRTTLGLSGDMFELAGIGSVGDFGRTFDVGHGTLAAWGKEFAASEEGKDTRALFRGLLRESVGALYRKLIENGDADRFKAFHAYVEGWIPTVGIQHSEAPGETLTEEERESLDLLLEKNTVAV